MKSCKVFCLVHTDATGYNGRIKVLCYHNPGIEVDTDNHKNSMDSIEYCKNKRFYKITIQWSPCILCISCDPNSGNDPFQPTGVDLLLSLQQNIQMRGVEYCLGAMILSNGNHFCSIVLDPIPLENLNIFYNGIKQGNCHTNLVPFAGS